MQFTYNLCGTLESLFLSEISLNVPFSSSPGQVWAYGCSGPVNSVEEFPLSSWSLGQFTWGWNETPSGIRARVSLTV